MEISLHRAFIILSILAWCACVNGQSSGHVNCEKYVYHPSCRGMQSKKRFVNTADNDQIDPACPCRYTKKLRNKEIDTLANSKFLEALFANGFNVNSIYDAYAASSDRRKDYNFNRDRSNQRSKSIKDNFIDLDNADKEEVY